MLKIKQLSIVLLAFAISQMGRSEENPLPSKTATGVKTISNQFWWPERLDLAPLRQHTGESNPMDSKFNYAKEFKQLDLKAVKADIERLMKTSQARFLSVWPGIVLVPTAWGMVVAVLAALSSASNRSTVGQITQIWIRHDAYFGRSRASTGVKFHGPI